jgi:hypothetical protein
VSIAFGDVAGLPLADTAREAAAHAGPPWYATDHGMLPPALWWIEATPYGVFPLTEANSTTADHPGKTPVFRGSQNDPTRCLRDRDTVEQLWSARPWCNVGIAANLNRLLILDVDPRDGGIQSVKDLADEAKIDLADVPRQSSPNADGGVHFFWALPDGAPEIRKRSPLDGIDIPWQVPIAPSLRRVEVGRDHRGGVVEAYRPYTWAAGDPRRLPTAPPRLIDLLGDLGSVKGRKATRREGSRLPTMVNLDITELLAHGIPHGQQNNTVQALATSMARRDVPYGEAVSIIANILEASPQDARRGKWSLADLDGDRGIVRRAYAFIGRAKEEEAREAVQFAAALRRSLLP